MTALQVNDKIRLTNNRLLETITYTATVVKVQGDCVWVEVPAHLRNLRMFPVNNGKRYAKFLMADVANAKVNHD